MIRPGLVGLFALVLTVAACGAPDPDGGENSSGDGDSPGPSAEISLLTASIPESLNPIAGFGNTGMGTVNEGLLTLEGGPTELPELVPNLAAADPEVSADARVWTVTLQDGVTFSDGSTLDAADVVATYEAVADPASASPIAGDLVNLESVEAVDDTTVRFTLKESQVSFRTALLIGIAPSESITAGQQVAESPLNQEPVGTGPYVIESFSTDRLVLVANDDYRDGAPELGRITYVLAADDNTRAQRMTAGEFDGSVLPPRLTETFENDEQFEIFHATSADWRGLSLPADNPVTSDPAVRMALNIGIDRQAIIDGVLVGTGRPAHTFIPPEYGEYHNADAVFPYDVEQAARLLDAAGWVMGADGIRVKDGRRAEFTLMYRPSDLVRRDLSAAFASEVLPLGFDVTIEGVDFDQAEPRAGQDAILLGGGDTPYDVDSQIYKALHSSYPAAGAFYDNPSQYADPEMDAALHTGRTSVDPAARVEAYQHVQELYVADPSMVLLVFLDHTYVQKASVGQEWDGLDTMLEPHEHGTAWGPWVNIADWTRRS
ncbi:ABC transporter substrate-binding protein [Jiangella mangrovi]|uniref:Peptide/nickel transport system substrate-binding protein n=1 Tax=Jiangella mangrovi TaxID=1524084 RepID=A0A7W9GUX4_9ACTN|nr:ABC transporter substrate-binding protein [Jiangella mangrovi]MBB5790131.1 peptide/nickel transport system substrate-binding protein [Jiangella mangrovi]